MSKCLRLSPLESLLTQDYSADKPIVINGGPTGAFAGFIFVLAVVTTQTLVEAEIASMLVLLMFALALLTANRIPLSGGPYNWVAVLSPHRYSNFLSYMTGWLTTIAWQALLASVAYLEATIIQALAALSHPNNEPQRWQATLILYATVLTAMIVNTALGRLLPALEAAVLIAHILGFFGILFTICYLVSKSHADVVFKTFINGGMWQTNGQSFLIGSVSSMFMFVGTEIRRFVFHAFADTLQGSTLLRIWLRILQVSPEQTVS